MATGYGGIHKQQKCEYLQLQLNTRSSCIDSSSFFVFQTLLERWTAEILFLLQGGVFFFILAVPHVAGSFLICEPMEKDVQRCENKHSLPDEYSTHSYLTLR